MPCDRGLGDRASGAGRPGISAVVITASDSATWRGDQLLLALVLVLGERDRVAARRPSAPSTSSSRNVAPRLSTCSLHDRAHVEGGDDRAEASGGGDRLQAGDAGAEDEHLRRRDRARRRSSASGRTCRACSAASEDGLVAGDRALRGERVHRLRAGDARDRVHRERGHAALGERLHELGVDERLQQRDEHLAVAQARDLFGRGLLHLADEVGLRVERPSPSGRPARRPPRRRRRRRRRLRRPRLDEHLDCRRRPAASPCPARGRPGLPRRRTPWRLRPSSLRRSLSCVATGGSWACTTGWSEARDEARRRRSGTSPRPTTSRRRRRSTSCSSWRASLRTRAASG